MKKLFVFLTSLISLGMVLSTVQAESDGTHIREEQKEMKEIVVFDKDNRDVQWRTINDSVMGGISDSEYTLTDSGTFLFQGEVSLENNGGFASVRSVPKDFGLEGIDTFLLRVKGDGHVYQFRLRTNNRWDGVAYTQLFETKKDEWIDIELPVDDFKPTFRGFTVPSAPPLDTAAIRQIGVLIAEKQQGKFRLEIESIKASPQELKDEKSLQIEKTGQASD